MAPSSRPAHRPSRRHVITDGAMQLFAEWPFDDVTVSDIAREVEMTSAAVYYHFASKDQILLEGLNGFCAELDDELLQLDPAAGPGSSVAQLLDWAMQRPGPATVFFVNSIGLNQAVEAVRRETRIALIASFREIVQARPGAGSRAEAAVVATALVSLLETALVSMLKRDETFTAIGANTFSSQVSSMADRMAGDD